jgi:hypothetical protein
MKPSGANAAPKEPMMMSIEIFAAHRAHPALAPPAAAPLRSAVAAALHGASRTLHRLALHLGQASSAQPVPSGLSLSLEFHAEAGAPEGALFVDGCLVAHLRGVRRL